MREAKMHTIRIALSNDLMDAVRAKAVEDEFTEADSPDEIVLRDLLAHLIVSMFDDAEAFQVAPHTDPSN